MIQLTLLLIFINIILSQNSEAKNLTEIVQTDRGPVQGEILTTVQNSSIQYSAFRGIPYAKPPIDELRYQPPVEVDRWLKTLNATTEAPDCPQIADNGTVKGKEDCLYLNIYSPWTTFQNRTDNGSLAVMVWIYGGVFAWGTTSNSIYGPDYLIANNVVIVLISYRIGPLGYLSLDIPQATGNQGMKDQVLGLKWVQKNIKQFGGDPDKVTIFGVSSGADAVLLHQLSPASKGLFRSVIAMSGAPLNTWALNSIPASIEQAFDIATRMNISTNNTEVLYRGLKNATIEALVIATNDQVGTKLQMPTFAPTFEDPAKAKDIFLSSCPSRIYDSEDFTKMPVLLGFTNAEAVYFASEYPEFFNQVLSSRDSMIEIGLDNNSPEFDNLNNFLNNDKGNLDELDKNLIYLTINATSDIGFIAGIDATQKILAQYEPPIYYYINSFDYPESRHRLSGNILNGTAHADDVLQVWWHKSQPLDPNSRSGIQRQRMTRLFTNFAKYSDPTPYGTADTLLNVNWQPSGLEGLQLEMGNDGLAMTERQVSDYAELIELTRDLLDDPACIAGRDTLADSDSDF